MIPGVNIISRKTSVLSFNGAGSEGGGGGSVRKFLDPKVQENPRGSAARVMRMSIYENTPKKLTPHPPPTPTKSSCNSRKGTVGA